MEILFKIALLIDQLPVEAQAQAREILATQNSLEEAYYAICKQFWETVDVDCL